MLMKYKSAFNNFRPLEFNPDKTKNYYRLLRPDIVALAASPETLSGLTVCRISWKDRLGLISLKNFITGSLQDWSIAAKINQGRLTWQAQTKNALIRPDLSTKIGQFINLTVTQNKNALEQYVYILINQENYQLDRVQDIIQRNLVYYFPHQVTKTLPDQTQVTELIADPKSFIFDKIKIGLDDVYVLEKNTLWPNLIFTVQGQRIFLSNNQNLLQQFLSNQTISSRSANNLEIFYWQNQSLIIKGALARYPNPKKSILINGFVVLR